MLNDELINNTILLGYKVLCKDCENLAKLELCCKCGVNPHKCILNKDKLEGPKENDIK